MLYTLGVPNFKKRVFILVHVIVKHKTLFVHSYIIFSKSNLYILSSHFSIPNVPCKIIVLLPNYSKYEHVPIEIGLRKL